MVSVYQAMQQKESAGGWWWLSHCVGSRMEGASEARRLRQRQEQTERDIDSSQQQLPETGSSHMLEPGESTRATLVVLVNDLIRT